jgi:hypothetical protein
MRIFPKSPPSGVRNSRIQIRVQVRSSNLYERTKGALQQARAIHQNPYLEI